MSKLKFSAWLTHWNGASMASFEANAKHLRRVYPSWYGTGPAGQPRPHRDCPLPVRRRVIEVAKAAGVEVWPMIANYAAELGDFDPGRMRLLMGSEATRKMHIRDLLQLCKEDGATGVDLDYENIYDVDRELQSEFVTELAHTFHAAGMKVGMALHAKTSEPGNPGGSRAQDYAALGEACDSVQVMCYDYHWSTSGAGPVGPPAWAAEVLKHVLKSIPKEKVEMGLPAYGYDWDGTKGVPINWNTWTLLKGAAAEQRDPETAELILHHDDKEAWMNDSISMNAKLYEARNLGIDQAAMWVLGSEDPRLWALLESFPDPFLK